MAGNGSGFRGASVVGLRLVMGDGGENRESGSVVRGGDLRLDCSIRDGELLSSGLCWLSSCWAVKYVV